MFPVFGMMLVFQACYLLTNMHLNRRCAVLLLVLYVAYLGYSWTEFSDADLTTPAEDEGLEFYD